MKEIPQMNQTTKITQFLFNLKQAVFANMIYEDPDFEDYFF